MEGSGLEFDCCIVNVENTRKIHQRTPVERKILLLFFPPLSE
jgi:hypothetical protein